MKLLASRKDLDAITVKKSLASEGRGGAVLLGRVSPSLPVFLKKKIVNVFSHNERFSILHLCRETLLYYPSIYYINPVFTIPWFSLKMLNNSYLWGTIQHFSWLLLKQIRTAIVSPLEFLSWVISSGLRSIRRENWVF